MATRTPRAYSIFLGVLCFIFRFSLLSSYANLAHLAHQSNCLQSYANFFKPAQISYPSISPKASLHFFKRRFEYATELEDIPNLCLQNQYVHAAEAAVSKEKRATSNILNVKIR